MGVCKKGNFWTRVTSRRGLSPRPQQTTTTSPTRMPKEQGPCPGRRGQKCPYAQGASAHRQAGGEPTDRARPAGDRARPAGSARVARRRQQGVGLLRHAQVGQVCRRHYRARADAHRFEPVGLVHSARATSSPDRARTLAGLARRPDQGTRRARALVAPIAIPMRFRGGRRR
jgi:hypothetical protein